MGSQIRAFDWSSHPLGAPADWPVALKTLVALMLNANQPMYIAWGPGGHLLYNDAYAPLLVDKHPQALGLPLLDVWAEIAEPLKNIADTVRSGTPVHMDDIQFMLHRHGNLEETHFSFSMTPVRDGEGPVAGMFCACAETTAEVFADRRVAEETQRQRNLFAGAPGFITVLRGPQHVYEFVNDSYLSLFGNRAFIGQAIRDVFPELEGQGFYEWMDQVYATGKRFVARDVPIMLTLAGRAEAEQRFLDFIYEPVINDAGQTTGIFCEGYDVTETHKARSPVTLVQ